jgi:uncharacterized integral membrane protein
MASASKGSPYKRRRPSLIRNFWVYRRLVALAVVLGVLLWFMLINNTEVTVSFPFHLATVQSTVGTVILISALVGSLVTGLSMTIIRAWRGYRGAASRPVDGEPPAPDLPDDRPPPDYAARTTEGFPNFP